MGRKFLKQATFLVIVAQVIPGDQMAPKITVFGEDQSCRASKIFTIRHGLVEVWTNRTLSKMQNNFV